MKAIAIISVIIICMSLYATAGMFLARWDTPRAYHQSRTRYHGYGYDDRPTRQQRNSLQAQIWCMILFWPILSPIYGINNSIMDYVRKNDPEVLRKKNEELERKNKNLQANIKRLERETYMTEEDIENRKRLRSASTKDWDF